MNNAAWNDARSVLCIRLDSLGDVLMCTPAIRAIKQSRPGRCVSLLTSREGVAAAPFIPEVDAIIDYAAPWMEASGAHHPAADTEFIASIAARHFDAVAIFTSFGQSALPAALTCYLAGIPLRIAHCRENPRRLLSDWIPDLEPATLIRHEVRRQLDLVASVGCTAASLGLSFSVLDNDVEAMRARLLAAGINPDRQWLLLHPDSSAPPRRYRSAHWADVIRDIARRTGVPIILAGNAAERPLIDEIHRGCGDAACLLAGELNLGELGAAIKLASVIISNDTGSVHLAAAVGTPVVDLCALTAPQHTPWQVESLVLFNDGTAPARVVDAACALLARSARMMLRAMMHKPNG
ncbi:glycosyltransferase family 9 protein [Massilia cavernae]|uniref:Glycosyltransferase family 9 protein n=1 Tax=Massilia cavernae TaxID=2320864 RepID=A0A418XFZ4_9BURK|nr:glycosyltransferase family 9 protein [Massilia cavernae]RJG11379.1 glycosyltransferase family 9 protein [Massilia cavernae]